MFGKHLCSLHEYSVLYSKNLVFDDIVNVK